MRPACVPLEGAALRGCEWQWLSREDYSLADVTDGTVKEVGHGHCARGRGGGDWKHRRTGRVQGIIVVH